MLEYRVNIDKLGSDVAEVELTTDGSTTLMPTIDPLHDTYNTMICDCMSVDGINVGTIINATTTISLNYYGLEEYNDEIIIDELYDTFSVRTVNTENKTFTFEVPRYVSLPIEKIETRLVNVGEEENVPYIYFTFSDRHHFDVDDKNIEDYIRLYLKYFDKDGRSVVLDTNDYTNADEEEDKKKLLIEVVSPTELRTAFDLDDGTNWQDNEYITEFFNLLFPFIDEGDFIEGEALLWDISIDRDNFLFTDRVDYVMNYNKVSAKIKIPLFQKFETNALQEDILQSEFVNKSKRESINAIRDNERSIYYPVSVTGDDITELRGINFNLHFRQHRGDDWIAGSDSYWNGVGVTGDNDTPYLIEDFFPYATGTNDVFKQSNQSDLLRYINMNNNDVKYQKNRLKKSFLRLLFYDSDKSGTQNLLSYATIFYNTGELFGKYAKNIEESGYMRLNYNDDGTITNRTGLIGIGADREYETEYNEEKRLSTRLSVYNKNMSRSSSDGFYLYLFKESEIGTQPQDIYMRVEFNHAGYGRTIPFMMPYDNGIKTFSDIISDWSSPTGDGYGINKYKEYSYIKLKAQYNSQIDKHIYYLDNEVYDNISDFIENNILNINLYEAKIRNKDKVEQQSNENP